MGNHIVSCPTHSHHYNVVPLLLALCSLQICPRLHNCTCQLSYSHQGPVTEECLFRSAAVPLLLCAGSSLTTTIFLSPLVFGLAHLHHFYEFRVTNPETPLAVAIARSVIQLSYTSLFGAYATFLFLRTGSLLAVTLVHAFCNCMGLPRVSGRLEPYWLSDEQLSRPDSGVRIWTGAYYVLLVAGAVGWWWNLYALTESTMALASF